MSSVFRVGAVSLRARALAVAALLGLSLGLSGCGGKTGPQGPAAAVTQASGTIQGTLRDQVTQQPIVGALVDIGTATATTNAQGEFVLTNVVVSANAANQINAQTYLATINLKNVTSPVNMASAAATPRYPDFSYQSISITFTSPYTTASSSVIATPVTGLVATVNPTVGKLAATITGTVADSLTKQAVGAGYTVKLVAISSANSASGSGGTGAAGNIVGSTTTDASGNFTFANIESGQIFNIDAWNAAQTMSGSVFDVVAPADGQTKTLSIQGGSAVFVSSTDALAPSIISVTPEQNADLAPAATNVVFTFSEPIKQTADTSTSPSIPTGLYNTVAVNYAGAKASNIDHSLSWNSTFTQLTVTIPTLAVASKYTVSLAGTGTTLKDVNDKVVNNLATVGKGVLAFTTNGSTTPAAPTPVTVTNSASLNYNSPTVVLNWPPVSGAKAYNVYRAQNYPGVTGQPLLVGVGPSTLTSDFSDTLPTLTPFVSGQNKLTYTYVVRSVSADNNESASSTAVTAQDTVAPTVISVIAAAPPAPPGTYTITFSEPMDEVSANTQANYQLAQGAAATAPPTIKDVALNAGLTTVTLTLSAAPAAGNTLTITTGEKDIASNPMALANTTTF